MKRSFIIALSFLLFHTYLAGQKSDCLEAFSRADLTKNSMHVYLGHGGSIVGDGSTPFFPRDLSTRIIANGGLWISGFDQAGNLNSSAKCWTDDIHGADFFPGILNSETGATESEACSNWDKFFAVPIEDIELFQADWEDNGIIDDEIPASIKGWPARGNSYFYEVNGFELPATGQGLAPFIDKNGNQQYEPENGDYPNTKGADEAIWWVFNDAGAVHGLSQGDKGGYEIQAMAYAYTSETEAVNNTIFYDMKLINRGDRVFDDVYISLWFDFDIAKGNCYLIEKSGCVPDANMVYTYVKDSLPCSDVENYPMVGVKIIEPLLDNDYNDLNMHSFINYYNSAFSSPPINHTDPTTAHEYRFYMEGKWRDGSSMVDNHDSITLFQYPDAPDDLTGWSMCTSPDNEYDSRILMNMGPLTIIPGTVKTMTFAVVGIEDVGFGCPSLDPLNDAISDVEDFYRNVTSIDAARLVYNEGVQVSPNPMTQTALFSLDNNAEIMSTIKVFSITGELIWGKGSIHSREVLFTKNAIPSGVYFYKIESKKGTIYTGKFSVL